MLKIYSLLVWKYLNNPIFLVDPDSLSLSQNCNPNKTYFYKQLFISGQWLCALCFSSLWNKMSLYERLLGTQWIFAVPYDRRLTWLPKNIVTLSKSRFRNAYLLWQITNWGINMADKIKCSHILVKKQSEAFAILERLKKGEGFANLAREFL